MGTNRVICGIDIGVCRVEIVGIVIEEEPGCMLILGGDVLDEANE